MLPAPRKSYLDVVLGFPMVLGVALALFVLMVVPKTIEDPDIWWHLRDAQMLMASHQFLTRDGFSFTALHAPWMNHEWIAELPFYAGWVLGKGLGVHWVTVIEIELITLGLYVVSYSRSGSPIGSFVVAFVGMFLSQVSYGPRTLLLGWLLLIVELAILLESERRPKLVWLLPPLYVLWVNTHGSWMIGLVLLVLFFAASAFPFQWGAIESRGMSAGLRRNMVIAALLSVAGLFVNPYGWRLVAYPFNMAFHQKLNIANVEEWRAVDFHSPRGDVVLIVLAVIAIWQVYGRRRWEAWELAFLALGLYSALVHERFLFLFAIVAAPIFASRFPRPVRTAEYKPKPLINAVLIFLLLVGVVCQVRPVDTDSQKAMPQFPVDALPFLEGFHPQGNVFNEYLWGGYMIWNVRDVPVFVDSRVDIFEYNGTFKDYLDIVHLKQPIELLDRHQIRYVLFEKDTPLVYLLQRAGGWKVDYEKGDVIVLERVGPCPAK